MKAKTKKIISTLIIVLIAAMLVVSLSFF